MTRPAFPCPIETEDDERAPEPRGRVVAGTQFPRSPARATTRPLDAARRADTHAQRSVASRPRPSREDASRGRTATLVEATSAIVPPRAMARVAMSAELTRLRKFAESLSHYFRARRVRASTAASPVSGSISTDPLALSRSVAVANDPSLASCRTVTGALAPTSSPPTATSAPPRAAPPRWASSGPRLSPKRATQPRGHEQVERRAVVAVAGRFAVAPSGGRSPRPAACGLLRRGAASARRGGGGGGAVERLVKGGGGGLGLGGVLAGRRAAAALPVRLDELPRQPRRARIARGASSRSAEGVGERAAEAPELAEEERRRRLRRTPAPWRSPPGRRGRRATCARRAGTDRRLLAARDNAARGAALLPRTSFANVSATTARRARRRRREPARKRGALLAPASASCASNVRVNGRVELRDFAAASRRTPAGVRPSTSKNPGVSSGAWNSSSSSAFQRSAPAARTPAPCPPRARRRRSRRCAMAFTSEDLPTPVLPSTSTLRSSRARSHARSSGVSGDRSPSGTAAPRGQRGSARGPPACPRARRGRGSRRARFGARGLAVADDATSADGATGGVTARGPRTSTSRRDLRAARARVSREEPDSREPCRVCFKARAKLESATRSNSRTTRDSRIIGSIYRRATERVVHHRPTAI